MTKSKKSISIILSFFVMMSALLSANMIGMAADYKTVSGTYNYSYASQVLELVNEQRRAYGLNELTMTESLTDGAMLRAAETVVSFSHTRPNGEQCFTAFNWTRAAGENIAYGQRSPAQVMNSWMNSSGHRANILSTSFTTIGIGCFEYNGTLYWAQAFSGGSGTSSTPSGTKKVTVDVSLVKGMESKVTFGTESTTAKATTTQPSTTKPTTTQQTTTKQTTTQKTTTKPSTTKEQTTKQQTTKSETTTKAPAATQPSTTKQSVTIPSTSASCSNNSCKAITDSCNSILTKYINCKPCTSKKAYLISNGKLVICSGNNLLKCETK